LLNFLHQFGTGIKPKYRFSVQVVDSSAAGFARSGHIVAKSPQWLVEYIDRCFNLPKELTSVSFSAKF
jgi:hypothetical protein